MTNWLKIPDERIRHVWVRSPDDSCREVYDADGYWIGYREENIESDIQHVSPESYADVGTPICECGEDMVYSHTEVDVENTEENKENYNA
jgi:hypothetical protein